MRLRFLSAFIAALCFVGSAGAVTLGLSESGIVKFRCVDTAGALIRSFPVGSSTYLLSSDSTITANPPMIRGLFPGHAVITGSVGYDGKRIAATPLSIDVLPPMTPTPPATATATLTATPEEPGIASCTLVFVPDDPPVEVPPPSQVPTPTATPRHFNKFKPDVMIVNDNLAGAKSWSFKARINTSERISSEMVLLQEVDPALNKSRLGVMLLDNGKGSWNLYVAINTRHDCGTPGTVDTLDGLSVARLPLLHPRSVWVRGVKLNDGVDHDIAVTFDGDSGTTVAYIDKTERARNVLPQGETLCTLANSQLRIGSDLLGYDPFNGDIYLPVTLVDRVLSPDEIAN